MQQSLKILYLSHWREKKDLEGDLENAETLTLGAFILVYFKSSLEVCLSQLDT